MADVRTHMFYLLLYYFVLNNAKQQCSSVFTTFQRNGCVNYLDVYTTFGAEHLGSVYYFQVWETLEVYTILGTGKPSTCSVVSGPENLGSVYYFRI